MASVPLPHQFAVGEDVTATNINTYYSALSFLENVPIFKGITTINVGFSNNSAAKMTWNNNVVDTYGGHSTVTNPSRYTSQLAGYYWCAGGVQFNTISGTGGILLSDWFVNGSPFGETLQENNLPIIASTASPTVGPFNGPLYLNVGDYLEMSIVQNTGASQNVIAGFMSCFWIHA